ncbi:MAG: LuxR C-terminal-related transcriptional regulator [Thermomicrobiales bacterium]
MAVSEYRKRRARDKIAQLAGEGHDLVTFWQRATVPLASVVPHYLSPCWHTLDPASLLITSHYQVELPELPAEWLAHEYYAEDAHKMSDVIRSERGYSTLYEATGGEPSRSRAWNMYIHPYGGDQELFVALRTKSGDAWGLLALYREPDRPLFSADDCTFLRDISTHLAEGARRGLLLGEAGDPEGAEAPGLIILKEDWSVESLTPGVERWLEELPDGAWSALGKLPPVVLSVAARALRTAENPDSPGEVALARVLSRAGRWMVLHGASLVATGSRRVAVIIEPAHPARISSLLMAAYGLTEREQEVTRVVLQGNSTTEIAAQLQMSAHTVQQHLKSIFDKTGVRSRRELTGKVFFSHYEPRLRDNEHRAIEGRPLRGGPLDRQAGATTDV